MIQIFDEKHRRIGKFKSFNDVMDFFNSQENIKVLDPNSLRSQGKWNFVYYSHRRLSALYEDQRIKCTEIEHEACINHLDLIEIYTGDLTPQQLIVTTELDVAEVIKNWCFDYCYAMKYVLLETILGTLDEEGTESEF
ncbi:MAG: hypothetical protein FJX03_02885 [Alphaproteobacteria bacterium]|nr:hypothetical protein [Alphaproteobacteria bacterium]